MHYQREVLRFSAKAEKSEKKANWLLRKLEKHENAKGASLLQKLTGGGRGERD